MRHIFVFWALVALVALAVYGCGEDEGETMEPGKACLKCHGSGDDESFSLAGTVFESEDAAHGAEGVLITILDAEGSTRQLSSNRVGNFFSEASLVPPFTVSLGEGANQRSMQTAASSGDCNSCHRRGADAPPLARP